MFTVTQYYEIMDYLALMNSSRELIFIYAIDFIIRLYLILLIGVQHPM
jgi:hypothetical protein